MSNLLEASIGRHNEDGGVMMDTSTAMRDPVFYRWHSMIDYLFLHHKNTLPPYADNQLRLDNIKIDNVEFVSDGKIVDELRTYWHILTNVNLQNGLDFAANETVYVTVTHSIYEKFSYKYDFDLFICILTNWHSFDVKQDFGNK